MQYVVVFVLLLAIASVTPQNGDEPNINPPMGDPSIDIPPMSPPDEEEPNINPPMGDADIDINANNDMAESPPPSELPTPAGTPMSASPSQPAATPVAPCSDTPSLGTSNDELKQIIDKILAILKGHGMDNDMDVPDVLELIKKVIKNPKLLKKLSAALEAIGDYEDSEEDIFDYVVDWFGFDLRKKF